MEIFNPEFVHSQLFWVAVCFLIMLGVIWRYAMPTVIAALDERANKISDDLERADSLKKEAEKFLKEYEAKIKSAQKEASEIITKARKESDDIISTRMMDMEAELKKKSEEAAKNIDQARAVALEELRSHVADMTMMAVERAIDSEITKEKATKLTDDALKEMAH